jgi:hypothetical protein
MKIFVDLGCLSDSPAADDVERILRNIALSYGDYPDSARCRIDTLQQGIKYK